jgi:hypothetical protein
MKRKMRLDIKGMLHNLNIDGKEGAAYRAMVAAAPDVDAPTLSEAKALLERLLAEGVTDYAEYLNREA